MRPLEQLIDPNNQGQKLVDEWLAAARAPVEVLPCSDEAGARCLSLLQVTTRSPMGAIAYGTGGLLVDGGWVRVIGGGCEHFSRTLATWNGLDTGDHRLPGAMLVGDDALGGFFAINGGRFEGRPGSVHYFAPDALAWEDLDASYSDWLVWLLTGDLERFYGGSRWSSWRADVARLAPDRGVLVYPFPFAQGPSFDERTRGDVPIEELWVLYTSQLATGADTSA